MFYTHLVYVGGVKSEEKSGQRQHDANILGPIYKYILFQHTLFAHTKKTTKRYNKLHLQKQKDYRHPVGLQDERITIDE